MIPIVSIENTLTQSALPQGTLQKHNAFPDVVVFEGREYLTFRSAPMHFPHAQSQLVVCSRIPDGIWEFETVIKDNQVDLRDPKLVVYQNRLFLYFCVLKANKRAFHPIGIRSVFKSDTGTWSSPIVVYSSGWLVSRIKVLRGDLHMGVYAWDTSHPTRARSAIIKSRDGTKWNMQTEFGVCEVEGTESDFIEFQNNLYWIVRNDQGKYNPSGTQVYVKNVQGETVQKIHIREKYDAPIWILHSDRLLLLARRNKRRPFSYNLISRRAPILLRYALEQLFSVSSAKVTVLLRFSSKDGTFKTASILPSCGDTGYCGYWKNGATVHIYTYATDCQVGNIRMITAQKKSTSIYRYTIVLK